MCVSFISATYVHDIFFLVIFMAFVMLTVWQVGFHLKSLLFSNFKKSCHPLENFINTRSAKAVNLTAVDF